MEILTTLDLQELAEGSDIEVKRASGKDGQGELPVSLFESYVAMANTDGGLIFLGIDERPRGTFSAVGIANPPKVLKSLWDGLNNRQQVSVNLLTNQMVEVFDLHGYQIIRVKVPRARRSQRPVYAGQNPLTGTYRRNYEGDYRCDEETVRRMLAEQVEDIRDARLLENFGFDDLEISTLNAYRNQFKATRPDHPWLTLDDREFLRSIGGWTRDRQTGTEGLTLAGLLMFGKLRSILDAVPHYVVDYQERLGSASESRWIDRVTTDGAWSGNVYDFYRQVIQRLYRDLKVPFKLQGAERIDETPVHEALREALVNTLIHADYTGRTAISVIKWPDTFGFRNPGTMRLPLDDALDGGTSDCRNRNLQKMFQLAGLGEQAGSGIPKIHHNWKQQHWQVPSLWEDTEPEQTVLAMRMASLLPTEVVEELDNRFGPRFRELSETQRLALATVAIEEKVTHARLKRMTPLHPHDLTKELATLVKEGFLESAGQSRGTFYFFADRPPKAKGGLFQPILDFGAGGDERDAHPFTGTREESSEHLPASSEHLPASSEHLPASSEHLRVLESLAAPVRTRGKVARETMEQMILQLCKGHFLTLRELALLLDRSPDALRIHYLSKLLERRLLELRYPDTPSHPDQGYRTAGTSE